MPINPNAEIELTTFAWVPEPAHGLVKDLRVRWALEEAGLDYGVRLLNGDGPADYCRDQPFNQVPCLSDETVRIFESGAIVQYIGERNEVLLPRDTPSRFRAIQWSYAALNSIEHFVQERALIGGLFAGEEWAKLRKPSSDEITRVRLGQLSQWLGDSTWLEGERFTIGDLMMVTVLRLADRAQLLGDYPNLSRYLARGQERPAFQQALSDQLATFREHQPQGVAA